VVFLVKKKSKKSTDKMAVKCEKFGPYSMVGLRIMIGLIFLIAGATKFGWLGSGSLSVTAEFFSSVGIPLAGFFAVLVAIIEFFGGIAVILGVATRVTTSLLAIITIVAILAVHLNSWIEVSYPLLLLAALIALKINGPGNWALWNKC